MHFHFAEAADAPEALGELIDQDLFGGIGGLVFAAETGAKLVELGRVFRPGGSTALRRGRV